MEAGQLLATLESRVEAAAVRVARARADRTVVPEPPLDDPRTAQVVIVDRVLDGASGTFGVRLLLPNPNRELPAGLRCQARMTAARMKSGDPETG